MTLRATRRSPPRSESRPGSARPRCSIGAASCAGRTNFGRAVARLAQRRARRRREQREYERISVVTSTASGTSTTGRASSRASRRTSSTRPARRPTCTAGDARQPDVRPVERARRTGGRRSVRACAVHGARARAQAGRRAPPACAWAPVVDLDAGLRELGGALRKLPARSESFRRAPKAPGVRPSAPIGRKVTVRGRLSMARPAPIAEIGAADGFRGRAGSSASAREGPRARGTVRGRAGRSAGAWEGPRARRVRENRAPRRAPRAKRLDARERPG